MQQIENMLKVLEQLVNNQHHDQLELYSTKCTKNDALKETVNCKDKKWKSYRKLLIKRISY